MRKTELKQVVTNLSVKHYKGVTILLVLFTLSLASLIPRIRVDTDPENMLSEDEPVRVFHNQTKDNFSLSDIVVVGIINEHNPNGVFNPASLGKIYELTEFARTLRWPDEENPDSQVGVVEVDLLAPSTVDHIGQGGPGVVKFEWLMARPPATDDEALEIKNKAMSNPLLKGTLVSEDGKAICLYLPLTSKDLSYKVYSELKRKIAEFAGDEEYHITGLPVAEDTFGVEMFIQMAVSAPLAMVVIFILMLLFFRKLVLVISPMIVALVSVISTMGLLIGFGYPVHIMSSMIPIFLMPIAVVDSVHILSEFFDRYKPEKGRKDTILEVMGNLFAPMLYTSLTSAAGFASLALTPIPPVQVFGVFVAVGIMIAWLCTITFVPAYVMMIKEESLANFGSASVHEHKQGRLGRILSFAGRFTSARAKTILVLILVISASAVYGITRIQINDNPVKWFSKRHPIRRADIELNKHFGGTYMAYLVLEAADAEPKVEHEYLDGLRKQWLQKGKAITADFPDSPNLTAEVEKLLLDNASADKTRRQFLNEFIALAQQKSNEAENADRIHEADAWYEVAGFFEMEIERLKLFKQPNILEYVGNLQQHLKSTGVVGKSNSVANVVKKVYQELTDGREENFKIPVSSAAVAQCLLQFQSSHNPDDLWHLVTYDYDRANIWIQLTSGDNKDMEKVVKAVDEFFAANPPPARLKHDWAGLTYINTVWQDKMVAGMLQSFMGSFIIVFIMMAILFRSALWGIVCMIPLLVTIAVIYGVIGLVGKDYDMPVAVLSALTLGMAVDFAIHFLQRSRTSFARTGSWKASAQKMFGEPAVAICRNVAVIAIGFLPLLAAPLVPYKTVGIFLCAIMALSGLVTLTALPAILTVLEKRLFKPAAAPKSATCNCGLCFVVSAAAVVLLALNLNQYTVSGWSKLLVFSIIAIPVMALICGIMSRRQACKVLENKEENDNV
ncbi:MAG TPA: MMPL family transporter [Planctomycetes bacterium]|nr:MMPL family transporter [Planctomycetota bacterium]HIJ70774.1 MMPL family transporter [Planctomycetota bacterium]